MAMNDVIKMDTLELNTVKNIMLEDVQEITMQVNLHKAIFSDLLSSPTMQGEFLNRAYEIILNIKKSELNIQGYIEDMAKVIEKAIERADSIEREFFDKFNDIAERQSFESNENQ